MSVGFNWFKENVIIVQNLIEKYSGKRIPQISSEGVHLSNNKIDLIEPSEMVEICNKILANTECDEFDMRDRIEWFRELSENGYYLTYDYDW